jgi:cyclopropane fatty-acyl-phospholipid synthase-like methyltransferase
MTADLPFSQACENNKVPILSVLSRVFADCHTVLEVGSGTGQHATFFAQSLPQLRWLPTDTAANLPVLAPRCANYPGDNLGPASVLDVRQRPWAVLPVDAVFTANTLHIMSMAAVGDFFSGLATVLTADARLAIYGPFNYGGRYTCASNAQFDQWLAARDPQSAIRDFEAVDALARDIGLRLLEDNEMPANNRLLVWSRA